MVKRRAQRVELVHVAHRIPRIAVSEKDAAAACGLSLYSFRKGVRPYVRSYAIGRVVVYPLAELQAFLDRHAVRREHT